MCYDYHESAKKLDREHLGKQRVEAYQILNTIEDLYLVAQYFNYPLPMDNTLWKEWIRILVRSYLALPIRFARNLQTGEVYTCDTIAKSDSIYHYVTLTFPIYHPAVLMWLGHTESLKEYINAHIFEWMSRGYKNTMRTYEVQNAARPLWSLDEKIYVNHRAALLKKEIERSKPAWFVHMPEFVVAGTFTEYIWPY